MRYSLGLRIHFSRDHCGMKDANLLVCVNCLDPQCEDESEIVAPERQESLSLLAVGPGASEALRLAAAEVRCD